MPGTYLGEVSTAQILGAAQSVVALTPQATDPAVSATTSQIYAKTDKAIYHEDTAGLITNLLLPAQVANSALGPQTLNVGPFSANNTSNQQISYGFNPINISGLSYVVQYRCSVIGVSALSGTGGTGSGNVALTKNGVSLGTVLAVNSPAGTGLNYFYTTFNNGVYVFQPGDQLNFAYTGSGTTIGISATISAGSQNISSVSSVLSANTIVSATDNQRVWLASASSQYTLTLPATQATQDFYVRVVVTGTGGVKVQAPSGVTIYNGQSSSTAGGSITSTSIGAYAILYNPAGTSIWTLVNPSSQWTVA